MLRPKPNISTATNLIIFVSLEKPTANNLSAT
jgi:hypothetical protein